MAFDEKKALDILRNAAAEIEDRVAQAKAHPREDAAGRWVLRSQNHGTCQNVARDTGAAITQMLYELAEPLRSE